MIKHLITSLITTLAVSATAFGQVADTSGVITPTVNSRIAIRQNLMLQSTPEVFENPAMRQWMLPESYSSIGAQYHHMRQSHAIDVQRGDGLDFWGIDADSYMKYKSSTLWGTAAYHNGHQRGINWNESSDADLVYPYFLADSIGGDMRMETYSFAGGYADHTDRWAWGVTLSYNAGLYYRNVDPRPRNTTGRLDISAGAAIRIGSTDYRTGLSVNYRKYKQTADLEFVNELADGRVWHTTGLGTHYERFAGQGYAHYYKGNRWGVSADLFPQSRRGAVASVGFKSFKFDHVLTSLNNLPLQTATDNQLNASFGWLAPGKRHDWNVLASFGYGKRRGTENIFGDPSANVYPQIGSMALYTHTMIDASLTGLYQWHAVAGTTLAVQPSASYSHSREAYLDPARHLELNAVTPAIKLQATHDFTSAWRGCLSLKYAHSCPMSCSVYLPYDKDVPVSLQNVDITRYYVLSKSHNLLEARADVSRAISSRYALMLSAVYARNGYTQSIHSDMFNISLSFVF